MRRWSKRPTREIIEQVVDACAQITHGVLLPPGCFVITAFKLTGPGIFQPDPNMARPLPVLRLPTNCKIAQDPHAHSNSQGAASPPAAAAPLVLLLVLAARPLVQPVPLEVHNRQR